MTELTRLLNNAAGGDTVSLNQLYDLVFAELRAIAAHKMASERPDHTLQPTALVNEAYLRLESSAGFKFENRAHFFAAAAEAMRRILVDNARRHGQLKRGGNQERVEFSETRIAAPVEDEKILLVNEALEALAREDPVKADVVKLRYFVGLKHQEIADALGVSEPTIRRHWAVARVRLFELIAQRSP
jgi:RNA polymerase sigma factor (TIGR02999 family)